MHSFPPVPEPFPQPSAHPMPLLVQAEVRQQVEVFDEYPVQRGRPRIISSNLSDIRRPIVNEFLRSKQLAANTRKTYERELLRFLNWTELSFRELTPNHLSHYREYLIESPWRKQAAQKPQDPLKDSSVNVAISTLRAFFKWLELTHEDLIVKNPMRGLDLLKLTEPDAQALSEQELALVWKALEQFGETKIRDIALIQVLSHGLRAGEAVALNLQSIVEGHQLFIAKSKNNEPRRVPLNREAKVVISAYLQHRKTGGEVLTPDAPLFLSHHLNPAWNGQRLSYHGVYLVVDRIGSYANLPELHPHRFRHTYATNLLRSGIDPLYAQILTGHKSEKSFRRYVRAVEQEEAMKAYYQAIEESPAADRLEVL